MTDFRRDLPPGLLAVVERMMAKDPEQRYQTPAEVVAALAPFAGEPRALAAGGNANFSRTPPGRSRLALLLSLTGILVGLGMFVAGRLIWRPDPAQPSSPLAAVPTQTEAARPTQPEVRLVVPDNMAAREAALTWVREHHRFDPTNPFPDFIAKKIDKEIGDGNGMLLLLSGGLLADNKPTLLAMRDGLFHAFELFPEEAAGMGQNGTTGITLLYRRDPRRLPQSARISALTLSGPVPIPTGTSIRGSIRYQVIESSGVGTSSGHPPGGPYQLRVTAYIAGCGTPSSRICKSKMPPGVCTFTMRSQEPGGEMTGPVLLYAEVCVHEKSGQPARGRAAGEGRTDARRGRRQQHPRQPHARSTARQAVPVTAPPGPQIDAKPQAMRGPDRRSAKVKQKS